MCNRYGSFWEFCVNFCCFNNNRGRRIGKMNNSVLNMQHALNAMKTLSACEFAKGISCTFCRGYLSTRVVCPSPSILYFFFRFSFFDSWSVTSCEVRGSILVILIKAFGSQSRLFVEREHSECPCLVLNPLPPRGEGNHLCWQEGQSYLLPWPRQGGLVCWATTSAVTTEYGWLE